MGFRALRVINEDRVIPGGGFPTHSHGDMEIISYVLSGAMEHKDSLGTGSIIMPGEIQLMSAGTGISHSEFNHSQEESLHFLQIWILPERQGLEPGYQQQPFPREEERGEFRLLADRHGTGSAVTLHQDVSLYRAVLEPAQKLNYEVPGGRHVWLQIMGGILALQGNEIREGDGAAISGERSIGLEATTASEVLLFDLA
jgi:redox-sensitive bicupin YhaK (pirin superfamily)